LGQHIGNNHKWQPQQEGANTSQKGVRHYLVGNEETTTRTQDPLALGQSIFDFVVGQLAKDKRADYSIK
jgi:hypothetical protein